MQNLEHQLLTLQEMLDASTTQAVSIAIITNEATAETVLTRSEASPRFGPDALFPTYSITKSFLSTVALRLVDSGELALDEPVARWLPAAPHGERITLRQLLQHTSGLPDYGMVAAYHAWVREGAAPWSYDEFIENAQAHRLIFEPDRGWGYSNIGYMIVRRLLETVCQERFEMLLQTEIFKPLGLSKAFTPTQQADLHTLIFGPSAYLGGDGPPRAVAGHYHPGWIAHGVIATTALEVASFYHRLLAGELLSPGLLNDMRQPSRIGPPKREPWVKPNYGLGLQIESGVTNEPIYGHTGAGPGSSASAVSLSSPQPRTVVVLSDGEDVPLVERMALAALLTD